MNQPPQRAQFWQIVRYLLVGGFNTCFGYALFFAFNYLFRSLGVYGSEIASLLGNVIAITVAFLGYKWFVFRTHGNYLREWLRCFAVYGVGMLPELIALPILTRLFLAISLTHRPAPYLAGAVITIFTATLSYFGHKKFSFRV